MNDSRKHGPARDKLRIPNTRAKHSGKQTGKNKFSRQTKPTIQTLHTVWNSCSDETE